MRQFPIYRASQSTPSSLRQGEILENVLQFKPDLKKWKPKEPDIESKEADIEVVSIIHSFSIVVTQDCDLEQDYNDRICIQKATHRWIDSVLLCKISLAKDVKYGEVYNSLAGNSALWNPIKKQQNERFHFFEKIPAEQDILASGLEELVADFKQVFSIDTEFLYKQIELKICRKRSVLVSPYLEHFSRRYTNFQSRVALPEPYESISEQK